MPTKGSKIWHSVTAAGVGVPPHKMPELFADACRTITNARTQRNSRDDHITAAFRNAPAVFRARKMKEKK
jgi:hypothetical protein